MMTTNAARGPHMPVAFQSLAMLKRRHSGSESAPKNEPKAPLTPDGIVNLDLNMRISVESRRSTSFLSIEPLQADEGEPMPAPLGETNEIPAAEDLKRDQYGFKKASLYVSEEDYNSWWEQYRHVLDRRRAKWYALLGKSGLSAASPTRFPSRGTKVRRYVRKGIPRQLRGAAWFFYAGGQSMLNKNRGVYEKLWRGSIDIRTHDSELIERDLHRTFPDNVHFKPAKLRDTEPDLIQSLRRVLVAFAAYSPNIGYCQSLNFIAGLLLLFMDEERTFWMLHIITQSYLPGMHFRNLEGVNVDQAVLMTSVKEMLPNVWAVVGHPNVEPGDGGEYITRLPPVTLVTAAWFMSLFINALPIESVLRIWDCLFYEGTKVLFRVALTVFKLGEERIGAVRDPIEVLQLVQTIPKLLIDAGALMHVCFQRHNGFGHISQEQIDERRRLVAEKRERVRLDHEDGDGIDEELLASMADTTMSSATLSLQNAYRKRRSGRRQGDGG